MAELAIVSARVRIPVVATGVVILGIGQLWRPPGPLAAIQVVFGAVLLVLGLSLYLRVGTVRRPPVRLTMPVRGRWFAVHSPADRVPSHGVQAYGQSYAIDLVHDPGHESRPGFGWWPLTRPASDFPGFGQPIRAAGEGTVVKVHGSERDHRSRTSWPSILLLFAETVREVLGPGRILGNHIVLDQGHGEGESGEVRDGVPRVDRPFLVPGGSATGAR